MRSLIAALAACLCLSPLTAQAERSLAEYRYFRSLSVDLQGRIPSVDDVAAFEDSKFDTDAWIDARLTGTAYAQRVRQIYMDLLRLEVPNTFAYVRSGIVLRRQEILRTDGSVTFVYFRNGQRRQNVATDGAFCLTQADTGQMFPRIGAPIGTQKAVSDAALNAATVLVKPWWLYRDYASATPTDRYDATTWATKYPQFRPVDNMQNEKNGQPTTSVRICKEEAQTASTGTVFKTGRAGNTTPADRVVPLPGDSAFATSNGGKAMACASDTATFYAADCGCGTGLERCHPGSSNQFDPAAFVLPTRSPLGIDAPFDASNAQQSQWSRFWWSEEAKHFIDSVVQEDRDFRDLLTGRESWVNGPLAHFYRQIQGSTCCDNGIYFGLTEQKPLFDTSAVPKDLLPQDTTSWRAVADRGALASGILTMPVFLTKYGSRRARAHVLYNAFLCRQFVAESVELTPSTEPDLTKRSGCSTCHSTLEPLSAYFSRVRESDWLYLPESNFPTVETKQCNKSSPNVTCRSFYDPAFSSDAGATLYGAYSSAENTAAGPKGMGEYVVKHPDYASCVVNQVASSLLGRPLSEDDKARKDSWATDLVSSGYKMRSLVRSIVKSDAYRASNNLSSSEWRGVAQ